MPGGAAHKGTPVRFARHMAVLLYGALLHVSHARHRRCQNILRLIGGVNIEDLVSKQGCLMSVV